MHYKILRNTYDEGTGRFWDIDRFAKKAKRKYGEDVYDQLAKSRVYHYIDRYRAEVEDIRLHLSSKLMLKRNFECDNAAFTMWLQGNDDMPAVVQACLTSMGRLGRKVIVLTEKNLNDYIYLPDYVWEKYKNGKMTKAHLADIVSVSALAMYGGVWIDSTVYVAGTVPEDMIKSFFVFTQTSKIREGCLWAKWWIAAPAYHEMILEQMSYLLGYWKHEDVAMNYDIFDIFLKKIIDNNSQYRRMIEDLPTGFMDQTHLLLKNYDCEYDEEKWEQMKRLSSVFKCSYKVKGLSSYRSFYCKLCNGELE